MPGRVFQTRDPATEKLLSPNQVLVLGTVQTLALAERRWQRPGSLVMSWHSSAEVKCHQNLIIYRGHHSTITYLCQLHRFLTSSFYSVIAVRYTHRRTRLKTIRCFAVAQNNNRWWSWHCILLARWWGEVQVAEPWQRDRATHAPVQ